MRKSKLTVSKNDHVKATSELDHDLVEEDFVGVVERFKGDKIQVNFSGTILLVTPDEIEKVEDSREFDFDNETGYAMLDDNCLHEEVESRIEEAEYHPRDRQITLPFYCVECDEHTETRVYKYIGVAPPST